MHDLASVSCEFLTFSHNLVGCRREIFWRYAATVIGFGRHFLFPVCSQKFIFATTEQYILKATEFQFIPWRDYLIIAWIVYSTLGKKEADFSQEFRSYLKWFFPANIFCHLFKESLNWWIAVRYLIIYEINPFLASKIPLNFITMRFIWTVALPNLTTFKSKFFKNSD